MFSCNAAMTTARPCLLTYKHTHIHTYTRMTTVMQYTCMHACTHTYTHTHTYIHTYIHTVSGSQRLMSCSAVVTQIQTLYPWGLTICRYVCMYVCLYMWISLCLCVRVFFIVHVDVDACMPVSVYAGHAHEHSRIHSSRTHTCIHTYIIHAHIQTHIHTCTPYRA